MGRYTTKKMIKSNIINENDFKNISTEVLEIIFNALNESFGPHGSTTILQSLYSMHAISKDGFTILNSIRVDNPIAKTILDYIVKVSRNLVRRVGDGTTTSVIASKYMFDNLNQYLSKGSNSINMPLNRKEVFDIIKLLSDIISTIIRKDYSTKITLDNLEKIRDIATISSNNDDNIGNTIYKVYKENGLHASINLEKSPTFDTYFDNIKGFEIIRGYILPSMVNQLDGKTCQLNNPYILLCNGMLTVDDAKNFIFPLIEMVCLAEKDPIPLMIIATDYEYEFKQVLYTNIIEFKKQGRDFPVLAIDMANNSKENKDKIKDLAINTGATIYDKEKGMIINSLKDFKMEFLGSCKKVKTTDLRTMIIEGNGNPELIKERIDKILDKINEYKNMERSIEMTEEIFKLERRINFLSNSLINLYIGGSTEDEKQSKYYLVEDAVFAVKSALEHGYTYGCGRTIPDLIVKNFDIIVENVINLGKYDKKVVNSLLTIIFESFNSVSKQLYENSGFKNITEDKVMDMRKEGKIYNLKTFEIEDIKDTKVINSTETEIAVLNNVVSIIGLLIISNQFITSEIEGMKGN